LEVNASLFEALIQTGTLSALQKPLDVVDAQLKLTIQIHDEKEHQVRQEDAKLNYFSVCA
jgi:hypothetical protein